MASGAAFVEVRDIAVVACQLEPASEVIVLYKCFFYIINYQYIYNLALYIPFTEVSVNSGFGDY